MPRHARGLNGWTYAAKAPEAIPVVIVSLGGGGSGRRAGWAITYGAIGLHRRISPRLCQLTEAIRRILNNGDLPASDCGHTQKVSRSTAA